MRATTARPLPLSLIHISSDTTIAEEVSQETAAGKIGLFVLSKLRSSSVLTDNLTVAQYDASENGYTVEPFSGFMYPMYAMISANATRPYTAMLFIEYLLTQEGFQPWGKSIGDYSTLSLIHISTVSSKAVIAAVTQAYNAAMGIAEPTAAPTA